MKKRSNIIKAFVSIAFIYVLYKNVKLDDFVENLQNIDPVFFAGSIAMSLLMISLSTLKWKVLLKQQGESLGFFYLLKTYLIGYYFSNLLPSNVGGDFVRSYYVGKKIESQGRAAVSTFLERFTGLLLLMTLVIFAPMTTSGFIKSPYFWGPAILACGILFVTIWLWMVNEPSKLPRALVTYILGQGRKVKSLSGIMNKVEAVFNKVIDRADSFHEKLVSASKEISRNRKWSVPVALLTIAFYLSTFFNVYITFRAFSIDPNFLQVAAITPTVLFLMMMPVALFGGLGFTEGVFVVYFQQMGLEPAGILAMALLLRFKWILLGVTGFPIYLTAKDKIPDAALAQTEAS